MTAFSEWSGRRKAVEIVRWICVLPAAYFISRVPYLFFWLLIPPQMAQLPGTPKPPPPSDLQRMLIPWLLALLTAPGFVLVGSLVAPRHRRYVAIVLALLMTLYAFLYHILIHLPGTPHYTYFAAAVLAAAGSAALVWFFDRPRSMPHAEGVTQQSPGTRR